MMLTAIGASVFFIPQDDIQRRARELVEKLSSANIEERDQAVEELKGLGPITSSSLKAALRQERDSGVRMWLEHVLLSFFSRKVCDGAHPIASPSGGPIAVVRRVKDRAKSDDWGRPVWSPEGWIVDPTTNREWRLVREGKIVGWRDEKAVLLDSGVMVEFQSGKLVSQGARLPEGLSARNVRRSSDGQQLVAVPDAMFHRINPEPKPPIDVGGGLLWVDEKREIRVLALGHTIHSDNSGFLSWSPNGKRVAFHLVFFRHGEVPLGRIGVLELATGKVSYVGESKYVHQNWGLLGAEGSGYAQDFWDSKGEHFVFVTGLGGGEGEIYVARADGSEVVRLTDDGQCKWSPVLDPAGRRVAFAAARWGGENGSLLQGHVRVLDLLTGEEERFQPPDAGYCFTLTWAPDGSRVYYDWVENGASSMTVFEAALLPPKKLSPGARILGKPAGSRNVEILNALRSEKAAVLAWGIEASGDRKSPEVVQALRDALHRCLGVPNFSCAHKIITTLAGLDAREAIPEIAQALDVTDEQTQCAAIDVVARWKVEGTREKVLRIMKETPGKRSAVNAAAALALMGHHAGWDTLTAYAESKEANIRGEVALLLGRVPEARSVEILIGLVADRERFYWDYTGEVQVGDHAEHSLAVLTGETFSRDRARWVAWWREKEGKLPELKGPNKALKSLSLQAERKAEQRQQALRERLKR